MKALRIRDWDRHYENNRSRELRRPEWLPLPNNFDGAGFMELCDNPAGTSHYGAWCLLLAAASRMPTRGLLVGDSGRPYSLKDLARMTRGQITVLEEAVPRLIEIGWLEWAEFATISSDTTSVDVRAPSTEGEGAGSPQGDAGKPQDGARSLRLKGNKKGNKKGNGDGAVAAAVSTLAAPAATATATGHHRVEGVDKRGVAKALETGDIVGLAKAFGGNVQMGRGVEWAREADGLTLETVAAILGWQRHERSPVREPSGLRAARARWRHELTKKYRHEIAIAVFKGLGIALEIPACEPAVPA